jgi:hypothetical protein
MRIDTAGTIWKVDYFRNAEKGETFHSNGNKWRKRSTRTAEIVRPVEYAGHWFYFRNGDVIERALT